MGACLQPSGGDDKVKEFVEKKIKTIPVLMFSKTTCPFCRDAKAIFNRAGVSFECIELNKIAKGGTM
jgi:ribosomal protein S27E